MTDQAIEPHAPKANIWRIAGWGFAAALILAPLVAMRLRVEGVDWSPADFVVAAFLIGIPGLLFELAVRLSGSWAYRAAAALGLLTGFLTVWINLAVGIVGNEDNPVNLMFFGVIAAAMAGAVIGGFKAPGMARAMFAAAALQGAIALVPWVGGLDDPIRASVLSLILAALWLGSGLLFARAARR